MRAAGRTRFVDAGLVTPAILFGAFFVSGSLANGEHGPAYPFADLTVCVVACAALLLRRRWPVALAAALIPTLAISASAMGATAVAIGAVAVYRSRRVAGGLTNARKHAPGAPVTVRLATVDGSGLAVEIVNAMPARENSAATRLPGAGSGLIGLRERVLLAGGRLEHGATPDGRFRLYAWLPWRP